MIINDRQRQYGMEVLKINGRDVNLGNVVNFSLTEGIDHPAIMGDITFKDYEGWLDEEEVFEGDIIEITWVTIDSSPIIFKGRIYASEGNNRNATQLFQATVFKFCSPWFFEAMSRPVSKFYKDQYASDIIVSLIEEAGGVVSYKTDPTGISTIHQLERFVTPNWTIAHSIKYLTNFAQTKPTNHGGLLFFPNIIDDSVQIMTISDILDKKLGQHPAEFMFDPENTEYEGYIRDYEIETLFENLRYINQGTFETDFYGFDYDRTKMINVKENMLDYSHSHLTTYPPIHTQYSSSKYKSIKFTHYHPNTRRQTSSDDRLKHLIEGAQRTKYSMLFSDLIKINFLTNGSTSRHVGQIVKCNWPTVEHRNVNPPTRSKQLEGYYYVRNIRHIFEPTAYTQALTLASDGYNFTKRNMMEWKN